MTYDELASLFNNLGHAIIPFDKTTQVYQDMVFKMKRNLANMTDPVKLHDMVEAMIKLDIDAGIRDLIRNRVLEGRFSRNAYDISILLHYYGNSYALYKNEKDLRAYKKVF